MQPRFMQSAVVAAALVATAAVVDRARVAAQMASSAAGRETPIFALDPEWPKPLPNKWVIGAVGGITVDARDHVWVVHRPSTLTDVETFAAKNPPLAECCVPAPPVLEFDAEGNVVQAWGGPGPGYQWPGTEHGIFVDHKDRVWVGSSGDTGSHVLLFTRAGQFLRQIGKEGQKGGSNDTANFGRPTQMVVDAASNELFVADGELNRRIAVFDSETGAFKREWSGYGEKPDDKAPTGVDASGKPVSRQFGKGAVHCVRIASDGLVYVCDRSNNRLQVFRKDGTFVKEAFVATSTRDVGSVYAIELSPDGKFVYVADGTNEKVWILSRNDLQVVGSIGRLGRNPGQFIRVHGIGVDSKGNLFTGESNGGQRVQKFVFKGVTKQ